MPEMNIPASKYPVPALALKTWFLGLPAAVKYFVGFVLLPTLIAAIYHGLISSSVYIAETKYALRINNDTPSIGLFESVLSAGSGMESPHEDASIVKEYIYSREMVEALDASLSIRKHYSSDKIDRFSRFDPEDSSEGFLNYYRGKIAVGIDSYTNVTTIRVHAFDPVVAHDIAENIIRLSEELVNQLSDRIVADTLEFARNEVKIAEKRVLAASTALTRFRSDTNTINPGEETKAVLSIITGLEGQLAAARTQLIEARSYMQANSPQVQVLKSKVDALEKQVKEERKRLSNDEDQSVNFTTLIDDYQPLVLEQELATKQYASTLTSLELARIEAQRKQRYLLPFIPPQIPDEALLPNRSRSITTVFLTLCVLYAIGGLIWAAIKDHMRI